MSFKQYNEMARYNGISPGELNREYEWSNKDPRFTELIYDRLPHNLELYKVGNIYYLTKYDQYIGYVEINDDIISASHRFKDRLKYGFYQTILPLIVKHRGTIYSDISLSKSAVHSYTLLNKSRSLDLKITNGTVKEFDPDLLMTPGYRVQIDEDIDLDEYYRKIKVSEAYQKMLKENTLGLFTVLFDLDIII